MKTAHQLGRELLAGPNLPIWHFDPSRAGTDPDQDTSLCEPTIEHCDSREGLDKDTIAAAIEEGAYMGEFLTINGEADAAREAMTTTEVDRLHALKELNARVHSNYDFNADPDEISLLVGAAIAGQPRPEPRKS